MGLFGRVFVSHLVTILVASVGIIIAYGVFPDFYHRELDTVISPTDPKYANVRTMLEERNEWTMFMALATSLPISLLLAVATAYLATRRIAGVVQELAEGCREIAKGRYGKRLEASGQDELAEIARCFNDMVEALEKSERIRVDLIGMIGHELRTPLASLQGYAEALVDGLTPPKEAAQAISREVNAMKRLASDLLLVARVEADAFDLQPTAFEPRQLIAEVQDRFVHAFEDQGLTLRTKLAEELPPIYADWERVGQALGNLLLNALRYTPAGGDVVLSVQAGEDAVWFAVADSGPGITPEHQPRIFRRFYRVDSARRRGDGGAGIGLTVAKSFIEAMGGRIWLESELGQGATFYFTLPAATNHEA